MKFQQVSFSDGVRTVVSRLEATYTSIRYFST